MSETRRKESGQALLLVIVGLSLFLLGTLGLAIDGAQIYAQRQMAQTAADGAAQAGIMNLYDGTNATSPNPYGTGTTPGPITCTPTNMITPCVYARLNGFGLTSGAGSDTVTVSFPVTITGVPLSATAVPAIAVSVQRPVKNTLIRMIGGPATTTIRARATAGMVGAVPTDCIYTLDPSASGAFTASNGATVTSGCSIEVKSSSASGGIIKGNASVTAPAVNGNFSVTNGGSSNPAPTQKPWTGQDPYASLPAPTVASSCDAAHTNFNQGYSPSTVVLNPGTYCGGITLGNGVAVTFNPGIYVIKGGALNIGYSFPSGDGVMFYLTGTNATYGSVNIGNGAGATFTPATSGIYTGILFFQDRSITSAKQATFNGGVSLKLTGGLYFPTTTVSFSNGSSSPGYPIAIVADQVSFTGGTNVFTYDPTGTKTGLAVKAVALVE